jgi:hypothetical protein
MCWYQLSSEIRCAVVREDAGSSARDADTVMHEAASPVSYTIDESLYDLGRYKVSSSFNIGTLPVSCSVHFIRAEGL